MASKPKKDYKRAEHGFPPLVFPDSKILILGSFPSVKSREAAFFYGHPQNRFWPLLAKIANEPTPATIAEKTTFCKRHHYALYDSIESCAIIGSSDATIKDVEPADLKSIVQGTQISLVVCNGKASLHYFELYQSELGIPHVCLPSTSPANAQYTLERLAKEWGEFLK